MFEETVEKSGRPIVNRRTLIAVSAPGCAVIAWWIYGTFFSSESGRAPYGPPPLVPIADFSPTGHLNGVREVPAIVKSARQWRNELPPPAFEVTRNGATEIPFTGSLWDLHDDGLYRCICCDTALFASDTKFDSDTGWPSFWKPIAEENIRTSEDGSFGIRRTAVMCRRCAAHLGHVFDDGPEPSGLRYCINSAALRFVKFG